MQLFICVLNTVTDYSEIYTAEKNTNPKTTIIKQVNESIIIAEQKWPCDDKMVVNQQLPGSTIRPRPRYEQHRSTI